MAGVLGVATMKYLPYRFFNLLNPMIALVYAYTGFRVEHVPPTDRTTTAHESPPPPILVATKEKSMSSEPTRRARRRRR